MVLQRALAYLTNPVFVNVLIAGCMKLSITKFDHTPRSGSRVGTALLVVATMLIGRARADDNVPVATGASVESVAAVSVDVASEPDVSIEPDRWVVGCRHLSSGQVSHLSVDQLKYWRLTSGQSSAGHWQSGSANRFTANAAQAGVITIYVHGNQVSSSEAFHTASRLARILGHGDTAVGGSLVTFSWPSGRIAGNQIHDARVKATRSDRYAPALAHFIAAQPDDVAINLIGHSYGSRLIAVALDQLADDEPPRSGPIRAILLASAFGNGWLLPGHRCGAAVSRVESLTVTVSSADRVLRWYPLLWGLRNRGSEALGDTGLVCRSRLGDDLAKYRQINVSCAIGKSHNWQDYVGTSRVRQAIRELMRPLASQIEDDAVAHALPQPPASP